MRGAEKDFARGEYGAETDFAEGEDGAEKDFAGGKTWRKRGSVLASSLHD